jgi:hypothetical protein
MVVRLLIGRRPTGTCYIHSAFTDEQMDDAPEQWAEPIIAARDEAATDASFTMATREFAVVAFTVADTTDAFDRFADYIEAKRESP